MRTIPGVTISRLGSAKGDVAHAEALISELAAGQHNTMTVIRLLYAATLCALAHENIKTAHHIVEEVTQ